MALLLKILAQNGDGSTVTLEPAWWRYRELLRGYTFEKNNDKGFLSYQLKLAHEDFVNIFLEQHKHLQEGVFSHQAWQKANARVMEQLQQLIAQPNTYSQIEIRIEEWESGL